MATFENLLFIPFHSYHLPPFKTGKSTRWRDNHPSIFLPYTYLLLRGGMMLYQYGGKVNVSPKGTNSAVIDLSQIKAQLKCFLLSKLGITFPNTQHKLTVRILGLGNEFIYCGHMQTFQEIAHFTEISQDTKITIRGESSENYNTLYFIYDVLLEGKA